MTAIAPSPHVEQAVAAAPDAFRIRRWHVACLALIVVIAALLRAHRIDATSVWCDELLSIHISNAHAFSVDRLPRGVVIDPVPDLMSLKDAQPAWKVWGGMGGDMHPPLYYLTLRLWRDVFGDSPTGIRSLSAVLGTLAVAAIFFAGREIAGTAAGLCVAAINALASNHIYYGQEARMYAFVLLWISIVMAIVLRIGRLGFTTRRGIALAACSLGAMLTLYLSSAVLIAAAIYAVACLRGRDRTGVIASFVAAAIGFAALWMPFLLGQNFHALKSDWLKADPHGHLVTAMRLLFTLPMDQLGTPMRRDDVYAYAFASVYLLPAFFVRRRPAILFPWLAMLLVAGIPTAADLLRTTNMLMWQRYTVLLIPTMSIAVVTMSAQLSPRLRWLVPAALILFCATSVSPTYDKERFDFRNNAIFAEKALAQKGGRLVFMSTWNEKFDSVLLLACQYYWAHPPQGVVFVESAAEFNRLPADVTGDRVILFAGDRNADLRALEQFGADGRSTMALGVGTVNAMRRLEHPTSATRPTTAATP